MCGMPTAAERYKFSEVDSDGNSFISEALEQSKVHHVDCINQRVRALSYQQEIIKL